MPKAAYPPDVRERALALYLEVGPTEASRQTGVPRLTISTWARRANATVSPQHPTAPMVIDRMERIAENLKRIADDRTAWVADQPPSKDVRAPMTVAAIAIDKAQLLTGKATVRVETVEEPQRQTLGKLLELRQAS